MYTKPCPIRRGYYKREPQHTMWSDAGGHSNMWLIWMIRCALQQYHLIHGTKTSHTKCTIALYLHMVDLNNICKNTFDCLVSLEVLNPMRPLLSTSWHNDKNSDCSTAGICWSLHSLLYFSWHLPSVISFSLPPRTIRSTVHIINFCWRGKVGGWLALVARRDPYTSDITLDICFIPTFFTLGWLFPTPWDFTVNKQIILSKREIWVSTETFQGTISTRLAAHTCQHWNRNRYRYLPFWDLKAL